MSEAPTAPAVAPKAEAPKPAPPAAKESDAAPVKLPDDHPLVTALETLKAENRALKTAADSGKTEAEKVAERLAEVEKRAADAEARATRRDVALEFRLSTQDAGLLDAITDEKAMRSLAERLAGESDKKRNFVPREGNNPPANAADGSMRDLVRGLFRPEGD